MVKNRLDLAIYHFLPIEGYPPIQNLLDILREKTKLNFFCVTTLGDFPFEVNSNSNNIYRLGRLHKIHRFINYFTFNIFGFFLLLYNRPKIILYYETISAFPVLYYAKLFPKTKVYIHYHEYVTKKEYQSSSPIIRYYHKLEQHFYGRAHWISQTNKERLDRFCRDSGLKIDNRFHILPNYPPLKWKDNSIRKSEIGLPQKMVYVGYSLDFVSMYAKEVIDWVVDHPNLFSLDFYLFKIQPDVKIYADAKKSGNISWHNALPYNSLPQVLKNYDTGLILYKGLIENYVFNAPNKLFEYLACGLNVLYSDKMLGIEPYKSVNVIPTNFEKLEKLKPEDLVNRNSRVNASVYFAENALSELIKSLES